MWEMSTKFLIPSSDPKLLEKASRVAKEFIQEYINEDVVGIVFLGAIARGYFDHLADIDIAVFKKQNSEFPLTKKFYTVEDMEVQIWLSDYESELTEPWDMAKRWTYSQCRIFYDSEDKISRLLQEKVPLKPEEKKWLMMSGLILFRVVYQPVDTIMDRAGQYRQRPAYVRPGTGLFLRYAVRVKW